MSEVSEIIELTKFTIGRQQEGRMISRGGDTPTPPLSLGGSELFTCTLESSDRMIRYRPTRHYYEASAVFGMATEVLQGSCYFFGFRCKSVRRPKHESEAFWQETVCDENIQGC